MNTNNNNDFMNEHDNWQGSLINQLSLVKYSRDSQLLTLYSNVVVFCPNKNSWYSLDYLQTNPENIINLQIL